MSDYIVGPGWDDAFGPLINHTLLRSIMPYIDKEYEHYTIYPPHNEIFNAFRYTPLDKVKVVIIGQDPYIREGQAHGLAFSVPYGKRIPPALLNVFKEIRDDIGYEIPNNGCLIPWAEQGVLLLNTCLTVRAGKSGSHRFIGWEDFISPIIAGLNQMKNNLVFMLWGKQAQYKEHFIDPDKHLILKAPYPGPLAGGMPFFGCKHFSKCNEFLYEVTDSVICWEIPNIGGKK